METLGVWLRQTREARGGSLKEAEDSTRIRVRFLEMLEAGDFAAFPGGEVQVRGFLRIYARYLGLSPDEVLARYESEVHDIESAAPAAATAEMQQAPPARPSAEPAPPRPRDIPVYAPRPRWLSLEALLIVGVVLTIVLAGIAIAGRFIASGTIAEPAATATAPAEAVLPTPTETPTPPVVTPTFPAAPQGGVTLTLEATEHVWVRVTTDGLTAFEGLLTTGQVETWSGQEVVIVDTGNGAGLLVTVNGQPQGVMGERGQVCTRAWGPGGEVGAP
nr:helix-turn-helix domain-containing protein [Anaerolineae bacterium]